MDDKNGVIFFKHLSSYFENSIDSEIILETVWSIDYIVNKFLKIIEGVSSGINSVEDVIVKIPEIVKQIKIDT